MNNSYFKWILNLCLKIFTSVQHNKIFLILEFTAAKESRWFITLFKWYTWILFKRRFSRVWLRQDYQPGEESRTIYFLNHNSWWDGLIPFLLNEFRFHQNARAFIEDRQMNRYRFFQKIGAFSINRDNSRKVIISLRYAIQSMKREKASLFIYPEGTITPPGTVPEFEGGLAWLYTKTCDLKIDFVPIAIHMHTLRHDKPELYLRIGEPVMIPKGLNNTERTDLFEKKLSNILDPLQSSSHFEEAAFEKFI